MSARRDLERRLAGLGEIRGIMNSMKSLALMEARKLERLLESQRAMVATIDEAARDLLRHYPDLRPRAPPGPALTLLVGSERGFCGDFNESLLQAGRPAAPSLSKDWILVGHKLRLRAGEEPRVRAVVDGPDVAEDVDAALGRVVGIINDMEGEQPGVAVVARYHGTESGSPVDRTLLPPWLDLPAVSPGPALPPLLNLEPRAMLRKLLDHYLFAALHEILLSSLWAENQRRARHLDGAVNRLDERIDGLHSRSQQLRQEEIIEEIEVILLNEVGPLKAAAP